MSSFFLCSSCGAVNPEFNPGCGECGHELSPLSVDGPDTPKMWLEPQGDKSINDRFEMMDLLGKGGMGVVYRAFDHLLNREVAVKILPVGEGATLHEARAISSLNHPNIVTVFDVFVENSHGYLVMELIDGEPLDQILQSGPLSLSNALHVGIQIADALDHAHRKGMVHGDMKPGNIMVTSDSRVKILDFGLASYLADTPLEQPKLRGTLVYMSPEQILREPVDTRSDLFSVGLVLYQMMSGKHPFFIQSGDNPLHRILHHTHNPIHLEDRQSEDGLNQVLINLLEKKPALRCASAAALKEDLRRLQERVRQRSQEQVESHSRTSQIKPRNWRLLLALPALLFLWAGYSFNVQKNNSIKAMRVNTPEVSTEKKSIAILPLRLIDQAEGDQVLRDGILATLTDQMIQLEDGDHRFSVVPASLVQDLGLDTSVGALEELGADLVLEGSLQRLSHGIRVLLHLVNTKTNEVLATKSMIGRHDQLAELQNQIATAAVAMIDPSMTFMPVSDEAKAFEYLLRGKGHFASRQSEVRLAQSILFFEKAVQTNPQSPGAHAMLARALVYRYRVKNDPKALGQSKQHAKLALSLSPQLADAWLVSGMISREDGAFEQAITQFEEAARLNPQQTDALVELGKLYKYRKQWALAENAYRKAMIQRTSAWRPRYNLGVLLVQLSRLQEAETVLLEAIQVAPGKYLNYQTLGAIYQMMGKVDLALSTYQKALHIKPSASVFSNMGTLFYFDKQFEKAAEAFRGALQIWKENYVLWANLGDACRLLPDGDQESREAYRRALQLLRAKREKDPSNSNWKIHEALYLARMGELETGRALVSGDIESQEIQEIYNLALISELIGKRDKALNFLGTALSLGFSIHEIKNEPDFKELIKDKDFMKLIKKDKNND